MLKQARSGKQGGWEDRSSPSLMMLVRRRLNTRLSTLQSGTPDLQFSLLSSALGGSSCGRSCLLLPPPIELLYNPLLPFSCPVVVKVHYCRGQSRGRWLAKHGVFIVGPKIWVDPKLSAGSPLGPPMPPTIQLCVIVSVPLCALSSSAQLALLAAAPCLAFPSTVQLLHAETFAPWRFPSFSSSLPQVSVTISGWVGRPPKLLPFMGQTLCVEWCPSGVWEAPRTLFVTGQ